MAIQFFVLPYCLPQIHWGEGLLAGTDSIAFHQIAKSEAQRIVNEGWHTWLLSPLGQAPAGIASAFYAFFIPKPWIMIPLYAALHSSSAIILLKIVSLFFPKKGFPNENKAFRSCHNLSFPPASRGGVRFLRPGHH